MIITLIRKPFKTSAIDNVKKHNTGGINIDKSRIFTDEKIESRPLQWSENKVYGDYTPKEDGLIWTPSGLGRWPANILLSYQTSILFPHTETHAGVYRSSSDYEGTSYTILRNKGDVAGYKNSGLASRYFKVVI